jgi:hypothetical protein
MIAVAGFGKRFLNHASSVGIWVCATLAMCALVFGAIFWARRVSARVSLLLSVIAWGVFVWLQLR